MTIACVALLATTTSCKDALGVAGALALGAAAQIAAEAIGAAVRSSQDRNQDPDPTAAQDPARPGPTNPMLGLIATTDGVLREPAWSSRLQHQQVIWIALQYDDPDQFRIAGTLLGTIAAAGARPVVLLETLPESENAALRTAAAQGTTAAERARSVADDLLWDRYDIDTPAMLEPLFKSAWKAGLGVRAGGTTPAQLRPFAEDPAAASSPLGQALAVDTPWEAARTDALQVALREQRCADLPDAIKDSLVLRDRARSAFVARRALAEVPRGATGPRVVVLVDMLHGRRDIGGPTALTALAARRGQVVKQMTVGLQELDAERIDVESYDTEVSRYDAVMFTPTLHVERCAPIEPALP